MRVSDTQTNGNAYVCEVMVPHAWTTGGGVGSIYMGSAMDGGG